VIVMLFSTTAPPLTVKLSVAGADPGSDRARIGTLL